MEEKQVRSLDLHYNGKFVPNPLIYFSPRKLSLSEIDLKELSYSEFIKLLEEVIDMECKYLYYCLAGVRLAQGLQALRNECDYCEFLEICNGVNSQVIIYIDHDNEPIFDWIEIEDPESEFETEVEDDDEGDQSIMADGQPCDHEEDEEVISTRGTYNDHFLNLLCPVENDRQDVEENEAPVYPRYNENRQWNDMNPELGMQFASPAELKSLLTNYAVAHGYDLFYERNDKDKLLAKCCKTKTPRCTFRLWASWMKDERTFQIKSLIKDHTCSRAFKLGSIVTYKWVGKQFVSDILGDPKLTLRKMKMLVSERFNINVSVGQCRNAKRFALTEIEGNLKDHYAKLWDYAAEILRANPGSHVQVCVEPIHNESNVIFEKFYVSFKSVVDGWLDGCRKVVGVDGCFLKGVCKGELLAAVGKDGNNHIYPIAWAVVNVENKSTWKWFLDNLMQDINEGGNGDGITLISDGHKGLMEDVKERCPEVEHRLCARHILANFNKRFKGECYIVPFWKAVNATTRQKFEAAMDVIKKLDVRAYEYLIQRDPNCWSKAFFKVGMDCDAMENDVVESFNSAVEKFRSKPLITMLEDIRVWVMGRLYSQKQKGIRWDLAICPAIRRKLEDMKMLQRHWDAIVCGYKQFEVSHHTERYVVDLEKRECGCRSWQLTGIPCVHGLAAIASLNHNPEEYVAVSFTKSSYMSTYEYSIHPLNDSSMWPQNPNLNRILPPKKRRLPGRPCEKRKRDQVENEISGKRHTLGRKGQPHRCSICHLLGHNKTKCPSAPTAAGSSAPTAAGLSDAGPDVAGSNDPVPSDPTPDVAGPDVAGSNDPVPSDPTPYVKKEDVVKVRKISERIIKMKTKTNVVVKGGKGSTADKPVDLE